MLHVRQRTGRSERLEPFLPSTAGFRQSKTTFQHLDMVLRVALKEPHRTSDVTASGFLQLCSVDPFSGQQFNWAFPAADLYVSVH